MSQPDPPSWQPPEQPGWQSSWQAPQPAFTPAPPTNGKATAALVLGICGIVVCPFVLSIAAVVFGYQARGEIDRSAGAQGGRGLATAGIVLGWVGIAMVVAIALLVLVFSVAAGSR